MAIRICVCSTDFGKIGDLANILRGIVHLVARIREDDYRWDFFDHKLPSQPGVPSTVRGDPREPMLANSMDDLGDV